MKIAILEPYAVSSHLRWAEEWKHNSVHDIRIFALPARHWKWRMHGAAITLSEQLIASDFRPDVVCCTDMMDLALTKSLLTRHFTDARYLLYFHENQFAYPFSERDSDKREVRDQHYAFINYASALAADQVWFNSSYNKRSMMDALQNYLKRFPDFNNLHSAVEIEKKSRVMYPGIDRMYFELAEKKNYIDTPSILWNHRWEYDKNPGEFFKEMLELSREGHSFHLNVVGESFESYPPEFDEYKKLLNTHIKHWGFVNDRNAYLKILQSSDIIAVTSLQEFFGYSVLEAIAAGCHPLLPNRLVYPEHLSDPAFFYSHQTEFTDKLRFLLNSPFEIRSVTSELTKYELSSIILSYDHVISLL